MTCRRGKYFFYSVSELPDLLPGIFFCLRHILGGQHQVLNIMVINVEHEIGDHNPLVGGDMMGKLIADVSGKKLLAESQLCRRMLHRIGNILIQSCRFFVREFAALPVFHQLIAGIRFSRDPVRHKFDQQRRGVLAILREYSFDCLHQFPLNMQ